MARMMRWSTGEATVERLLDSGHIERVQGGQACVAVLAQQGLRPIKSGGHYAAEIIAAAKILPNLGFF